MIEDSQETSSSQVQLGETFQDDVNFDDGLIDEEELLDYPEMQTNSVMPVEDEPI